eukprot:UN31095
MSTSTPTTAVPSIKPTFSSPSILPTEYVAQTLRTPAPEDEYAKSADDSGVELFFAVFAMGICVVCFGWCLCRNISVEPEEKRETKKSKRYLSMD